jgi:CBS-domain-containing membrane protein
MSKTVQEIMTTRVIWVSKDATFREMAVSEADMLAKEALAELGVVSGLLHHSDVRKAAGLTAGDLMTYQVVTVSPDDPVEQAARMMHFLRVRQLPVVNSGGELVGIVSRSDLLSVFDRPDEDINDIVDTMLLHEFLVDPRQFRVTVEAGVVTLEGTPETAALGRGLVRKARHVPGVVAVHDRLSYFDDYPVVAGPVL